MQLLKTKLIIILIFLALVGLTQDNPYKIKKYSFVKYELNSYHIYDTIAYNRLFDKLSQVAFKGNNKVSIVHIGDSHLQADFLSGSFRKKLQTFFLGSIGGRGFIFPYKVAQTNNPLSYKVRSTGKWGNCKNIESKPFCELGLSGMAVTTADSNATITISINDPNMKSYDFDRLMVFHEFGKDYFSPKIINNSLKSIKPFSNKGYTLFEFNTNIKKVTIGISSTSKEQNKFTLHGLNFDSNDSGIIYHTIGVNGAKIESYLKCKHFTSHLSALNPDWIIVSLGTNDSYTNTFDTVALKSNMDKIITSLITATPNAAILFTTPGDNRIRKVELNDNVEIVSNIIKNKITEYRLSYWDFNSIMGGKGSIDYWYYEGLSHTDYLHYSKKGYLFKSQLMFNAFLKAYDEYLEQTIIDY